MKTWKSRIWNQKCFNAAGFYFISKNEVLFLSCAPVRRSRNGHAVMPSA
jgi:hypothetical protein